MGNYKRKISRVDIQVSILTAVIVIISCVTIYELNYQYSYQEMIRSLQERVLNISGYLDSKLDKETFYQLDIRADEDKEIYQKSKELLENIKHSTGVRYLYTAKKAEDGTFIYLVDGLPSNSVDFRHVGDKIEEEIIPDMQSALKGNTIMPKDIKETSWGQIFIAYVPIHEDDRIIGVLGIEFEAASQYKTFRFLKTVTPAVIIGFCLVAGILAAVLFKRISNPAYRDLAGTDFLTGLKNRNTFDTDIHNLNQRSGKQDIAMVSIDLDNLKKINDEFGHAEGDEYIKASVELIRSVLSGDNMLYRVGGDEFAAVYRNGSAERLEFLLDQLRQQSAVSSQESRPDISISAGYAFYDPAQDENNLLQTLKRADSMMYQRKREQKKEI